MATVESQPVESGESQSFPAPYSRVGHFALEALRDLRLEVTSVREEADRVVILFIRPTSGTQWGAAGRMVIEKNATDAPTNVYINYTQRLILSGGGQERWARAIFNRIDLKLNSPLNNP